MARIDTAELSQRLAQLADALGGRAPSPQGLLVWRDALSGCERDDVLSALSDWPRRHAKLPVPADIVREATSVRDSREERSQTARRGETVLQAISRWNVTADNRAAFVAFKRRAAEIAASIPAWKREPRRPLPWEYASSDDDEEARLEREAIVAEGGGSW